MTTIPFAEGSHVRVIKLHEAQEPRVRAGSWSEYVPGAVNTDSLPVDYEIEGYLLGPVEVGGRLHVLRTRRNGIGCLGEFLSTVIQAVDIESESELACRLTTLNSIYRVVWLEIRAFP